ncbi:hypothetical protein BJX99DRAFT_235248 [Aspergillus californicus]
MLSALPAELLLMIASHLDDHLDTLYLAYCCHAFYPLLLPKVFTSLDLLEHRNGHLSHLTHTLGSDKKLANEVRTLRAYPGWRRTSRVRYDQSIMQPRLVAILGPDDSLPDWERELQNRDSSEAWLCVLLHLLPNLENFHMEVHEPSDYAPLSMLHRISLSYTDKRPGLNLLPLSNLRDISLEWWFTDGSIGMDRVLPLFYLPSLRTFTGKMISEGAGHEVFGDEDFDARAYVPANAGYSNVTHITLWMSSSWTGFADLIHAPKRLESFVFEHSNEPNDISGDNIYSSRFHPPLYRHRESLQELVLTYDDCTNGGYDDWDFVGSFVEFTALKKLQLRAVSTLAWREEWMDGSKVSTNSLTDVLPRSLETLIINDMASEHMGELARGFAQLVSDGNSHCPDLKYVEIEGNWMSEQQTTEESNMRPRPIPDMLPEYASFKETVGSLCASVGVEFYLRDLHVDDIMEMNRFMSADQ